MRARGATAAFAVLLLGTAGCGAITERVTESALGAMSDGNVDLDLASGGMSVEGPDGESLSFGATSDVPDVIADLIDLPSDFQAASTVEQSEGDRMGTTVVGSVSTSDPVALLEGLEADLVGDGWEREAFSNVNEQMVMVGLSRGEDENLNLSVVAGDDAMLSIVYVRPN